MSFGKWERGASIGMGAPQTTVSPSCVRSFNRCGIPNVVVAAVRSQGAIVSGQLGNMCVEVMLDSGSSISLLWSFINSSYQIKPAAKGLKLVSAAGEPISVVGQDVAPIRVGKLQVDHHFVAAHSLVTPVILGMDFLQKHGMVLDFTTTPVTIHNTSYPANLPPELEPILETARSITRKVCAVASLAESSEDIIDIVQFLCLMQCQVMICPNAKIQTLSLFLSNTENCFATHQARQM